MSGTPFDPSKPPPVFTPEQIAAAQAAMAKAAKTSDSTAKLANDINAITADTIALSNTFQSVGEKLFEIDGNGLSTTKFFPTWDGFHKRFTTLLWASRDTASDVAAYAQQFSTVILPFTVGQDGQQLTHDQKIQLLETFKQEAQSFHTRAQDTETGFSTLSSDLGNFSTTFGVFAKDQQNADNKEIDQLRIDIFGLQTEIDAYNKVITAMAISVGCTVLAGGVAAAAFPEFAPFILLIGIAAIITELGVLIAYLKKKADDQGEINNKQSRIDELEKEVAIITAAQAELATLATTDIVNIRARLGTFDQVWAAIVSDVEQIITWIQNGEKVVDIPPVLSAYLAQTNTLYQGLGDALILYASGIDESNVPKPPS